MARCLLMLVFGLLCGCAGTSGPAGPDIIFLVPGVDGDGPRYAALKDGLRDAGISQRMEPVAWGAPRIVLSLNFSNESINRDAEEKLASRVQEWRKKFPATKIDLIGHSAGSGVVLGALRRLPADVNVDHAIVLAPSV